MHVQPRLNHALSPIRKKMKQQLPLARVLEVPLPPDADQWRYQPELPFARPKMLSLEQKQLEVRSLEHLLHLNSPYAPSPRSKYNKALYTTVSVVYGWAGAAMPFR